MSYSHSKKLDAFTLTEMLVVLVIIGILVLLALPNLTSSVTRAKTIEAQTQLKHLHSLEQAYFYMHSKYSINMEDIDYEHATLTSEGGTANYLVTIVEASATGFKARATAQVDFDQDGNINVWEIDHKKRLEEVQKD